MTIKDTIINKLHQSEVEPRTKWYFAAKNIVFWVLFVFSVLIGGMAMSIVFHLSLMNPVHELSDVSWWHRLIMFVPVFWLGLLSVFVISAFFNVTHTKIGYKYNHYLIVVISILASFVLGFVFMLGGINKIIEQKTFDHVPGYRQLQVQQYHGWMNPEAGRLIGVVETRSGEVIELRAVDRSLWSVGGDPAVVAIIQPGMRLKIFGRMSGDHMFDAQIISPWFGGRMLDEKGCADYYE